MAQTLTLIPSSAKDEGCWGCGLGLQREGKHFTQR